MKESFEMGKPPPHVFTPGQRVWLSSKDITLTSLSRKLSPWQLGPYEVLERTGELTYCLKLPPFMRQHPVFHVDRLSPWQGNDINGNNPPPPKPIEVDNQLEYEVDEILDSRKYRNQLQYLVKWKGYDTGHNSWEPAPHLTHCPQLLQTFHSQHPAALRRLPATIFATLPWQPRTTLTDTLPCPEWELGTHPLASETDAIEQGVM